MKNCVNEMIGNSFLEIADFLESGEGKQKCRIGVTTLGSELGMEHIILAAEEAKRKLKAEVVLIGPKVETELEIIEANNENEIHKILEELLDNKKIDAVVTMHYNFPIGVSTIGKIISPMGKEIFLATTTGTTSTNRIEGMIKNAIYGNVVAKASGIKEPTIGILNIEGAKEVEKQLKKLNDKGYNLKFGASQRKDGGICLRGNDLILGSCDVVVSDSLTGNLLMKLFSAFTSGGKEEVIGYGYGPGVGFGYDRKVFIVSRASGKNVIKGAIEYAIDMVKGELHKILTEEEKILKNLNFEKFLSESIGDKKIVKAPEIHLEKEIVTEQIPGIDIMELDNAVNFLQSKGVYSESGMGCTGPIVMVNPSKEQLALKLLKEGGFIE